MFVLGMRELYPSISRAKNVVGHGHCFLSLSLSSPEIDILKEDSCGSKMLLGASKNQSSENVAQESGEWGWN